MLLFALIFVISPVIGLITITSEPTRVLNGNSVKLVCNVGKMIESVKWVYDGATYFSCDPPYTNCFTNTSVQQYNLYKFTIDNNSVNVLFFVVEIQNGGIWKCYHGNETTYIEIDNGDPPKVISFYANDRYENEFELVCQIAGQKPVNVLIHSYDVNGIRKIFEVNQTSVSELKITKPLLCSDMRIYCNVTNGYGPPVSRYTDSRLKCPLRVLFDLSILKQTLNLNDWYKEDIKVYIEGFPRPKYSIQKFDGKSFASNPSAAINTKLGYPHIYILVRFFSQRDKSNEGKYILTLKQDNITELVVLSLVYAGPQTTRITTVYTTPLLPETTITQKATSATSPRFTTTSHPTSSHIATTPSPTSLHAATAASPTSPHAATASSRTSLRFATTSFPTSSHIATTPSPTSLHAATAASPTSPHAATASSPTSLRFATTSFPTFETTPTPKQTENTTPGDKENDTDKKPEDGTIVLTYIGVAGFIIAVLVLIGNAVGIFWFIQTKRKQAGILYDSDTR